MARRTRRNLDEAFESEGIENQDDVAVVEENYQEPETFAEAKGVPANAHKKEIAKKEAAQKKTLEPQGVLYTHKKGEKCVKVIVKHQSVGEVYVGNMIRHKDGLGPLIKKWKEEGSWCEPHELKDKIAQVRAKLPALKKR